MPKNNKDTLTNSGQLPDPVAMAPMAGITNGPFRVVAAEAGCRWVWTEMIPAEGLVRQRPEIVRMLPLPGEPHPVTVQLFGGGAGALAEAAAMAEEAGADLVDINMACPVRRINRVGAGAALMRDPGVVFDLVKRVVSRVRIPVTVKIRAGWDDKDRNAPRVAVAAREAGAAAVTVHGRTRAQGFSGKADRGVVREVAERVSIPVILSGDVTNGTEARAALEESGAAAVMIGRAAIGNPWVFEAVSRELKGAPACAVGDADRLWLMKRHLDLLVERCGERKGVNLFKPHLAAYVKGKQDAARWRRELLRERSPEAVKRALDEIYGLGVSAWSGL